MLTDYKNPTGKFLLNSGRSVIRTQIASGANICNGIEDPSFLAFTLNINDKGRGGLFGSRSNPKTDVDFRGDKLGVSDPALDYAYDITSKYQNDHGYTDSAKHYCYGNLKAFVEDFLKICSDYPYYFQKISGLQEAYKKYLDVKTPYIAGDDSNITIDCLESADLRMHSIFDSYLNAVYDFKWRRQLIPDNLLCFDMDIIVHDVRKILYSGDSDARRLLSEHGLSFVVFRFHQCMFKTEALETMFANVANSESQATAFQFTFTYNNLEVLNYSLARYINRDRLYGDDDVKTMDTSYDGTYPKNIGEVIDLVQTEEESIHTPVKDLGNVHSGSIEQTLNMLGTLLSSVTGVPRRGLDAPSSGKSLLVQAQTGYLGKENVFDRDKVPGKVQNILRHIT